jgi:hypothetical protein
MLKKVINYKDYDGVERQEVAYFNLDKTECVDLNLDYEDDGGIVGHLKKVLTEKEDGQIRRKPAIDFVKLLIEKSYGVRPKNDPSLFLKEDENGKPLFRKFKQSRAYDTYLFALLRGDEPLDEFAQSIMPEISEDQKAEAEKMIKEEGLEDLLGVNKATELKVVKNEV